VFEFAISFTLSSQKRVVPVSAFSALAEVSSGQVLHQTPMRLAIRAAVGSIVATTWIHRCCPPVPALGTRLSPGGG
jgi:hypothetical protein